MKPLIKFEAIMWVALFGLLAILAEMQSHMPFNWAWFAKALLLAVPSAGVFVVLVLMFAAMTRVDPEDLWDSWWFKYMHRIWGTNFGGNDWRGFLCIDLCRAFWLSFFTAICWIVNFATWALLSYCVYNSATLEFFQHTSAKDLGNDIGLAACASIALGLIGFGISVGLLQNTRIACRLAGMMLCIVPSAILLTVFLVIIPLHFISVAAYFLWIGSVVGGAAISAAIIAAVVFVLIKTIPLAGSTIVSVLSNGMMRSWKEKTCVMIYSKKREEQKQSKDEERNVSEQ